VTGASGFVGRQLVSLAVSQRVEVVALVRNPEAHQRAVAAGARAVTVSDFSEEQLAPAFAGCEAVVHLANIGRERGGDTYEAVNVGGTRLAARAARTAGVGRFVYFSGLGVAHYGMTRHTTNAYFLSKLRAEALLFEELPDVTVFRPSYLLGSRDGLMTQLLADIARGDVEIPGGGSYRMQPLVVRDAAAAVLAVLMLEGVKHRVFDLVGALAITYRDLVMRVIAAVGSSVQVREVAEETALQAAQQGGYRGMPPEELACLLCDEVADPRPLQGLLGQFTVGLDEAIRTAVRGPRAAPPRA
jgi:nucleoside-diphosphate-sugar epimerase